MFLYLQRKRQSGEKRIQKNVKEGDKMSNGDIVEIELFDGRKGIYKAKIRYGKIIFKNKTNVVDIEQVKSIKPIKEVDNAK